MPPFHTTEKLRKQSTWFSFNSKLLSSLKRTQKWLFIHSKMYI